MTDTDGLGSATGGPDMGKFVRMMLFATAALAFAVAASATVASADFGGPGVTETFAAAT
jgi:hypothetical protein